MLASTPHNRHVCRHANHWKCPVVIVSIPLARRTFQGRPTSPARSGVPFAPAARRRGRSRCAAARLRAAQSFV